MRGFSRCTSSPTPTPNMVPKNLEKKLSRSCSAPVESFSAEDDAVAALRTRIMNWSFNCRMLQANSIQIQAATKMQAFIRRQSARQTYLCTCADVAGSFKKLYVSSISVKAGIHSRPFLGPLILGTAGMCVWRLPRRDARQRGREPRGSQA